jgi:hypothetical protein
MNLADTTPKLLDALNAMALAVQGLDDDHHRRALDFLNDRVTEIASTIDKMAADLHVGIPADDDTDADTDLLNLITAWRVVQERIAETDGTPEHDRHVQRSKKLLASIAETPAHTFRGALAKARVQFDDDEIGREIEHGAPMEIVGASGLRDLFRLTGTKEGAA